MNQKNNKQSLSDLIRSLDGKISQSNFDEFIDENAPLKDQARWLTEDMLLIEFENNLLLDVSWLRRSNKNGGIFVTHVIHGCDWEDPLLEIRSYSFKSLKKAIIKAHTFILGAKNIKRPLYCPHEPHD